MHIHLIGIGGTGLSAIARVLLESGYIVSGSDRALSPLARDLAAAGVQVTIGHDAAAIAGADLIVRSSAVSNDNPEVAAALAAGIPVLKRSEFLGRLMENKQCIAIAGTHGKTTTTAMIAWMIADLGLDPSYIIGGVSKNLGANAHAGQGDIFVIEADEYDRMFLGLHPDIAVITTAEHDHPDCFPTPADYQTAFATFVSQVKPGGLVLACAEEDGAVETANAAGREQTVQFYGRNQGLFRAANLRPNQRGGIDFDLLLLPGQELLTRVSLSVPGLHNVYNACAALAVARWLKLDLNQAARSLGEFQGTGRRFDVLGSAWDVLLVDDYGHHPTEIRTTLEGARMQFPQRRIWAVWQPHTYSRTQTLLQDFARAFDAADFVLVIEIYAAREKANHFSASEVVKQMTHPNARFAATFDDVIELLLAELQPADIVLVLSAGDADQINPRLLAALQERETPAHDAGSTLGGQNHD